MKLRELEDNLAEIMGWKYEDWNDGFTKGDRFIRSEFLLEAGFDLEVHQWACKNWKGDDKLFNYFGSLDTMFLCRGNCHDDSLMGMAYYKVGDYSKAVAVTFGIIKNFGEVEDE